MCVWSCVGKSKHYIEGVVRALRENGALPYTTVVVSRSQEPAAMQYLSAFAGCSLASHYRDQGRHALVVYDDMGTHGEVYNALVDSVAGAGQGLSLVQARILEQSTVLSQRKGHGSSTALCLVETHKDLGGNPTTTRPNAVADALLGMVDHAIYMDADLAMGRQWPPITVSPSLGAPAPRYVPALTKHMTSAMTGQLMQSQRTAEQHKWASEFGIEHEEQDRAIVDYRDKLQVLLSQHQDQLVPLPLQLLGVCAATMPQLEDLPVWSASHVAPALAAFFAHEKQGELMTSLAEACKRPETPLPAQVTAAATRACHLFWERFRAEKPELFVYDESL